MALKMSSSGIAAQEVGGKWPWQHWGVCVAAVAVGLVAQRCQAFWGTLHPAEGCCSSSHCSPGTLQLLPQELFGFAAEMTVLGQPCAVGPAASATCDGRAEDGRGLRSSRRALGTLGVMAVLPWCPG